MRYLPLKYELWSSIVTRIRIEWNKNENLLKNTAKPAPQILHIYKIDEKKIKSKSNTYLFIDELGSTSCESSYTTSTWERIICLNN